MLYTNEEPLVQRTCIKTASLQSEKLVIRKSVSEKGQSKKAQSEELSPAEKTSNEVLPKELKVQGARGVEITDPYLWASGINIFIG